MAELLTDLMAGLEGIFGRDVALLLICVAVNTLLVLLYWLWCHFRNKKKTGSYRLRCVVMLLTPVVGICFFSFGWLYYRLFFREPVDLDDVIFSKDRVKTHLKADEESERNLVPLEEAIAVTDKENTRALMMEVVRRDVSNSLTTISLALRSDDSEVSHYAASVLQETLGAFRMNMQKLYQRVVELEEEMRQHDEEDNPLRTLEGQRMAERLERGETGEENDAPMAEPEEDEEDLPEGARPRRKTDGVELYREEDVRERTLREAWEQGLLARDGVPEEGVLNLEQKLEEEITDAREIVNDLHRVLRQNVFSALEQKTFTDMMEEMAQLLDKRDVLRPEEVEAIALRQLEARDFPRCEKWCDRAGVLYPKALSTYTCKLKLYFQTGERDRFFQTLDELKQSKVSLDHETLEMVRVFL